MLSYEYKEYILPRVSLLFIFISAWLVSIKLNVLIKWHIC